MIVEESNLEDLRRSMERENTEALRHKQQQQQQQQQQYNTQQGQGQGQGQEQDSSAAGSKERDGDRVEKKRYNSDFVRSLLSYLRGRFLSLLLSISLITTDTALLNEMSISSI